MLAPGENIRVLIVDDSVMIRKLASALIERSAGMEVVGTAANGRIALRQIPFARPDVVALDLEMPEMNGMETLRQLRQQYPDLRIIMFSSATTRGATATLAALAEGADDYATKGDGTGTSTFRGTLCDDLIPKIRQFFQTGPCKPCAKVAPASPAPRKVVTRRAALVIGVSTGGPAALAELVPRLPVPFPVPILIVQHMPPVFTTRLAERLQSMTKLRVREAGAGEPVVAGEILIAPGNFHLRLEKKGTVVETVLDQGPAENSCRPAVDVLFRSAAEIWGGEVIAAILTGMGQDGLKGVEVLRAAGAYVIAQDEASSVVWGMPGAIVQAGLADAVTDIPGVVTQIRKQLNARSRDETMTA